MRISILIIVCLIMLSGLVTAQEVVVTGFPKGVGRDVDKDFFKPYYNDLKAIADTLHKYPLAEVVITGGADGEKYLAGDNTKNPALALGRAHTLRSYLTAEFNIHPIQIVISSEEVTYKGPQGRYASVRISKDSKLLSLLDDRLASIEQKNSSEDVFNRLKALEQRAPIEKHFTEIKENPNRITDNFGLQFSVGATSSPFGGLPTISGAVTWKRNLFIEISGGHTFWNSDFTFNSGILDTKKRYLSGQFIIYPKENLMVGIVGGWVRVEEISRQFYEYVKMSEGPIVGLRVKPFKHISVTAAYNPSKHRIIPNEISINKNSQFLLSLSVFNIFGGE